MKSIVIEAMYNSIHGDSTCRMSLMSSEEFKAEFSGELINVYTGSIQENGLVESEKNGTRFKVDVELAHWVFERKIDDSITVFRTSNQYGMRYFPFVSSSIKGRITVRNATISNVIIQLPDKYRFIRAGINVSFRGSGEARTLHDRGDDKSRYIFLPTTGDKNDDSIDIDIPVRLGGNALLRITEFPVYYGIISFIAVGLAAFTRDARVMVASLVAIYSFMLRHWLNSNPPQRSVLLTSIYSVTGMMLSVWGLVCLFFGYWAGFLLPIILYMFICYYKAVRSFSFTGTLPKWLQRIWKAQIDKAEAKQLEAFKK